MKQKINKLVHGVGLCDIPSRENGKQSKAYKAWQRMVGRCYDPKVHTRQPTYIGCSVVDEWKTFSNFKKFYDTHYRDGYQLDKDLLVDGNKVYGPEACIFVPQPINLLFVDNGVSRGVCPPRCLFL